MASRCPACDGPSYDPYSPNAERKPDGCADDPVYAGHGGPRAFAATIHGTSDPLYHMGPDAWLYGYVIETDTYRDQPQPELSFFSEARLIRLARPNAARAVLTARAGPDETIRLATHSGEPRPTCTGTSFVRNGVRYALRGSVAVESATRAFYAAPSGVVRNGYPLPFFSQSYLYGAITKDDARSVLALMYGAIRSAGIEDV